MTKKYQVNWLLLRVLKEVRPLDVQLISEQSLAELRGIFQYKIKLFEFIRCTLGVF